MIIQNLHTTPSALDREQHRSMRLRLPVADWGVARRLNALFLAAVEFGRQMAEVGYMVITGAAAGIMEAGHVGAGRENSFGLNILLPFESGANSVILDDSKLMNMRLPL